MGCCPDKYMNLWDDLIRQKNPPGVGRFDMGTFIRDLSFACKALLKIMDDVDNGAAEAGRFRIYGVEAPDCSEIRVVKDELVGIVNKVIYDLDAFVGPIEFVIEGLDEKLEPLVDLIIVIIPRADP